MCMDSSTTDSSFYQSLDRFSEALVQCPMCLYYIKVNPQTDSMKFRTINNHEIHFLTQHQFNSSIHTLILSYVDFSYSRVINYKDLNNNSVTDSFFSLYHLVILAEYQTFRNRVFELENNNNELIASFKAKLDKLETLYDQSKNEIVQSQNEKVSLSVENSILITQQDLTNFTFQILESENFFLKSENDRIVSELSTKENVLDEMKIRVKDLEQEINNLKNNFPTKISKDFTDKKLMDLFEQEKTQKRTAINDRRELEAGFNQYREKTNELEKKYALEMDLKEKELQELKDASQQSKHALIIDYEKKISDLTLIINDQEEKLSLVETISVTKPKNTKSSKEFRELINKEFVYLQKQFNKIQYNILLSLYDIETFNPQIRNSFEKLFEILVTKTNTYGRILLNDYDFSLFKDIREINIRLKFSTDQQIAALYIQALKIVLTDLLKYIFVIIKSIKATVEDVPYTIIPDDAEILFNIETTIHDNKITFNIPVNEERLSNKLNTDLRVFRPISELHKNNFIFFTNVESELYNNTYQLLPFRIINIDTEIQIEIDNFFGQEDTFQLCTIDEDYFIIQRVNYNKDYNFLKDFASKNKIEI